MGDSIWGSVLSAAIPAVIGGISGALKQSGDKQAASDLYDKQRADKLADDQRQLQIEALKYMYGLSGSGSGSNSADRQLKALESAFSLDQGATQMVSQANRAAALGTANAYGMAGKR